MAKKAHKKAHVVHRVHRRLETPVHNTVGYLFLLGLAVVTLLIVMKFFNTGGAY